MSTVHDSAESALRTKHWMTRLGFGLTAGVAIVLVAWQVLTYKPAPSGPAKLPTLSMEPGGRSKDVPGLNGHRVEVDGKAGTFVVHSRYRGGNECATNEACAGGVGDVVAVYVTNLDKENPNAVTWKYVPIK